MFLDITWLSLFETFKISFQWYPNLSPDHQFSHVWDLDEWKSDPKKIKYWDPDEIKLIIEVTFSRYDVQGLMHNH
jgi:hypothetical protein